MASSTTSHNLSGVEYKLREALAADITDTVIDHDQLRVRYNPARRQDALGLLKAEGFTFYTFCTAVDWPADDRIEVLDHVYNIEERMHVTIRCDLSRQDPRLPTGVPIYGGANWHEREAWELFGVMFLGHPRLQRLLLPEWIEGYPMRKDYELPARVEKPWPGSSFEG